MKKNKLVIIYHPNGKQVQYCTKDLGDSTIQIVESIVCDPGEVKVVYKENRKTVGRAYSGMPYILEMW